MSKFHFKKILIIKHGSLGDVINSTSVITAIREKFISAKIDILTSTPYFQFFKKMDKSYQIHIDNRNGFIKSLKLLFFLSKKKYDLIIDLQNSNRTKYYAFFLKIFSKALINGTHIYADFKYQYNKSNPPSVVVGLVNQIKLLGIDAITRPNLNFLEYNVNKLDFLDKDFFIINPGCSSKNNYKKWSAQNYSIICKYLISNKILPVLIGTESDRESIEIIKKNAPDSINLLNKSPLEVVYILAKNALGALSNDTGPAHLIASTNCKLHLVLSIRSNVKTVIPQSGNVTFNQADYINNIKTEDVKSNIKKIIHG
tara:strand:- start:1647 stop:2585 length:939 start_codon:yes stop_codon:yes gene_type:complete